MAAAAAATAAAATAAAAAVAAAADHLGDLVLEAGSAGRPAVYLLAATVYTHTTRVVPHPDPLACPYHHLMHVRVRPSACA